MLRNNALTASPEISPVSAVPLPSAQNRLASAVKTVSSNLIPSLCSVGTGFASAGSGLMGAPLLFTYAFKYFYNGNDPEWADDLQQSVLAFAVGCNIVLTVATRFPAIFREYHNTREKQSNDPALANGASEAEQLSTCAKATKKTFYTLASSLGFSSLVFASLNRFLSAVNLFEFIGHGTPDNPALSGVMLGGAGFCVISRFYSGYTFSFPLIKKSYKRMSCWIVGEGDINRWADIKNYAATFVISLPNIAGAFFTADFTTRQTLLRIPFVQNYLTFIASISKISSGTSLAMELSKSPAVRKTYENIWYNRPDDAKEIQALIKANLRSLKILSSIIYTAGLVDALMQGSNTAISIIKVIAAASGISEYNPYLFGAAILCWLSVSGVEFSYSTMRGWRDTKRYEIYPAFSRRGWVETIDENLNEEISIVVSHDENNLAETLLPVCARQEEEKSDAIDTSTPVVSQVYEISPVEPDIRSASFSEKHGLFANSSPKSRASSPGRSPQQFLTSTQDSGNLVLSLSL